MYTAPPPPMEIIVIGRSLVNTINTGTMAHRLKLHCYNPENTTATEVQEYESHSRLSKRPSKDWLILLAAFHHHVRHQMRDKYTNSLSDLDRDKMSLIASLRGALELRRWVLRKFSYFRMPASGGTWQFSYWKFAICMFVSRYALWVKTCIASINGACFSGYGFSATSCISEFWLEVGICRSCRTVAVCIFIWCHCAFSFSPWITFTIVDFSVNIEGTFPPHYLR